MRVPTFSGRKELVRYISEENRLKGNRPAVAAFLPDPPNENDSTDDHLSVNSSEVESLKQIADYHRWWWQMSRGTVALCVHKVLDYGDAAKKCGVRLSYCRAQSKWEFENSRGQMEDAYKHRPVRAHANPMSSPPNAVPLGSPSHVGVEFVRSINKDHLRMQFARRMARQRFHLK